VRSSDITKQGKDKKRPKPGTLFGALPKPAPRRQPEPERRPPAVAKPLPLSPRGFAVDVTPPGKKVSKAARGAAFIQRQSFDTYLRHHDDKLGPGQKKTINMLRHDPGEFLNPKNAHHLSSLRQPSDELKKAIDADPRTKHLHSLVLQATAGPPPTHRQVSVGQPPDPRTQAKGAADVRRAQKAAGKGMPGGALSPQQLQAGIKAAGLASPGQARDWVSKLAGGALESGVGMAPFLVHMATTDPRKSVPEVGETMAKSYWETLRHPVRQLREDPFSTFSNIVGAAGLGVGVGGRLAAAGAGVREAGTVGAAARAATRGIPSEAHLAATPWKRRVPFYYDKRTGEILHGEPGQNHGDIGHHVNADDITAGHVIEGDANIAHGRIGAVHLTDANDPELGPYKGADAARLKKHIEKNLNAQPGAPSKVRAATYGFLHPKVRNLIDLNRARNPAAQARRDIDVQHMYEDLTKIAEMPSEPVVKGGAVMKTRKGYRDIRADIRTTRAVRRGERMERLEKGVTPATAWTAGALKTAATELVDGVRAGTIYLRPAYLPNNWASNGFMNLTHQGFLAPVNLGTTYFIHKNLTNRELRIFRAATGMTPVQAIGTRGGHGYVRAVTDPIARTMGKVADQPFRDAALIHELKRRGIRKVSDMKALAKAADNQDPAALKTLSEAGIDASEEVVRFGKMNRAEQAVGRNVFFVWNWVRGAARYGAHFPLKHPVQANIYATAGRPIGNEYVQKRIGGLPPYLVGQVPIGGGKMINPWGVSPIGSTLDLGRALAGTAKAVIPGMGPFDQHTMEDWTALLNPVIGGLIEARERPGGRGYLEGVVRNIAVSKLYRDLKHPGQASTIFPGTRREAIGHFVFGSLYPRKYDPQAIQTALERMNINHPEQLIEQTRKRYFQKTGQQIPKTVENAYRKDLKELKKQKDFKNDYADSKNASSFGKLPPANRAEAAIDYFEENNLKSKDSIALYRRMLDSGQSDQYMNLLANTLWNSTGVGHAKDAWHAYEKRTKQGQLTKKR
jgi:hypothetical protein